MSGIAQMTLINAKRFTAQDVEDGLMLAFREARNDGLVITRLPDGSLITSVRQWSTPFKPDGR